MAVEGGKPRGGGRDPHAHGGTGFMSVGEFQERLLRLERLFSLLCAFIQRGPGGWQYRPSQALVDYLEEELESVRRESYLYLRVAFDEETAMARLTSEGPDAKA